MRTFLNVGGGGKDIPVPPHYEGWRHDLLDIDPVARPDILMDARQLHNLPAATYDAIYCSHNLEHYHHHDVPKVLNGFRHVLKPDGFAEIRVPDLLGVMKHVVENRMDVEDQLYAVPGGPILVRDVIYGYQKQIEKTGQDFFAHKTGFSRNSLGLLLSSNGFQTLAIGAQYQYEIVAFAFKQEPTPDKAKLVRSIIQSPADPFVRFTPF